jgi:ribosomal protein L11 methyltransferase
LRRPEGKERIFMGPDDPLYIYELEGLLSNPEGFFGENLLAYWREGDSHFLFFPQPREADLQEFLKNQSEVAWVRSHTLSYKDWQGGAPSGSLTVGKLRVVPPWFSRPNTSEGLTIRLDPGVVFGSGSHPTTRDSLQALLWIYDQDQPPKVLDLGTGTGILSLAAMALGAEEVLAVDLNPACVRTAEKNAELNELKKKIKIIEGRAEEYIHWPADLVLMNIHFAVIRELISQKAFFEKKWVVISGLMRSEFLEVKHRLKVPGFEILKEWDSEFTWFTLVGRNQA